MDDERICSICYETSKQRTICCGCRQCRIMICADCLYNKCKSLCPICDRELLNQPVKCNGCREPFHIKDTTMCCLCNDCFCQTCMCSHMECHSVVSSETYLPVVSSLEDIMRYVHCKFLVIGKINMDKDTHIVVVKDYTVRGDTLLLFIWDSFLGETPEILKKKKMLRMKCYDFGIVHRGVKSYNVHVNNVKGLHHIRGFYEMIMKLQASPIPL